MTDWVRYRIARLFVRPRARWSQADNRYPPTLRGGWRYFREAICQGEILWYESRKDGRS